MKTRTLPLVIPAKNRYWKAEVKGRVYDFRFPTYARAIEVLAFVALCPTSAEPSFKDLVTMLPFMGTVIGACWWNAKEELESVYDSTDLSSYGEGVSDELQEDLELLDILTLFSLCADELSKRTRIQVEAESLEVFTPPPTEGGT